MARDKTFRDDAPVLSQRLGAQRDPGDGVRISAEQSVSAEALMVRAREGDDQALEILYQRFAGQLVGYFRLRGASPSIAEDLLQETFLRVLGYRRSFLRPVSFRGWLYRIARSVVARAHRAGGRVGNTDPVSSRGSEHQTTGLEVAMLEDRRPSPLQQAEDRQRLERLAVAFRQLSPQRQELLILARWQRLPYAVIAEALGISEGAVKVRVHRALLDLARRLKRVEEVGHERS
ncbi:MAG: RNA polymerase sigma factor [Acidobacteriota bacterium]